MNLSELVQVYGAKKEGASENGEKSAPAAAAAKKGGQARPTKPRKLDKATNKSERAQPTGGYPPQMLVHSYPVPYTYDPSMTPPYPNPMVRIMNSHQLTNLKPEQ